MKEEPHPGVWWKSDRTNELRRIKGIIKIKVKKGAFNELKNMQAGHQKGNTLNHDDLKQPQSYLMTNKPNNRGQSAL